MFSHCLLSICIRSCSFPLFRSHLTTFMDFGNPYERIYQKAVISVSSPTLQILKTWSVVCLLLQSLHRSEADFFHCLRFATVGRVSIPAFRRNFRVPCFRSYMKLVQKRSCFSAAARARMCPYTVRLVTCSSHFCLLSTLFTELPTSV